MFYTTKKEKGEINWMMLTAWVWLIDIPCLFLSATKPLVVLFFSIHTCSWWCEVSLTDTKVKHAALYSLSCYFRVLCYYEMRLRNQFHKTDCSNMYALQKSNQGKIEFIFHENFMHSYWKKSFWKRHFKGQKVVGANNPNGRCICSLIFKVNFMFSALKIH